MSTPDADEQSSRNIRHVAGPARPGRYQGVVAAYDAEAGLGIAEAAGEQWLFHCTAIADGSRSVESGVSISFSVRAGGPGRFEAFEVTELS